MAADPGHASGREVSRFREFAREVIEHHFGSRPKRIIHESGGLSNFVFSATHSDGKFIIRISPHASALNSYIKEQWTQKAAAKAGVPTAEILEVGNSVVPHPYMVLKKVEGDPAEDHPDRLKIIARLGELAAKINSIRTKGFGATFDWSQNQLSLNDSWCEYLEGEYRFKEKIGVLEKHKVMDPPKARKLSKIFKDASKLRPTPSLCHGDLRLKNVLVDDKGKITALLDWEKSTSNLAPHWELSLALHDLGIDGKEAFVHGYGIKPAELKEATPLIRAFNILNYVHEVERASDRRDKSQLEDLRLRLSGALDMYSF